MEKWLFWLFAFVVLLGVVRVLGVICGVLGSCLRNCCRCRRNLLKRYGGEGTWALVTGASDGIGAEFCRQLARDGFNICLVSRTMSKLQAVEQEVRSINPTIETRIVQADFYANSNIRFYENLMD